MPESFNLTISGWLFIAGLGIFVVLIIVYVISIVKRAIAKARMVRYLELVSDAVISTPVTYRREFVGFLPAPGSSLPFPVHHVEENTTVYNVFVIRCPNCGRVFTITDVATDLSIPPQPICPYCGCLIFPATETEDYRTIYSS